MKKAAIFGISILTLPLLTGGCGNGGGPDPIPVSQITGPAAIAPAVNPAFERVSVVAVSVDAVGPYELLSATDYLYQPAHESLSVHNVPQASGLYVRITGIVAGTTYTIYTHAHGNHSVAANELTSLAVGLVASGKAARFTQAVELLAADPLLNVSSYAITDPIPASLRDAVMTQTMRQLAASFVDDPDVPDDQFEPGVHDVRKLLEATPLFRDVVLGALAYDQWWQLDSGGAGRLPTGESAPDYVRCKSCHGWDQRGTDGGYVRRTRTQSRPNAGLGDSNTVSRNITHGGIGTDDVLHTGRGRSWADGSGSWGGGAGGFSTGNLHPDFSAPDGLTAEQVANLVAFLNHSGARAETVFEQMYVSEDPVTYVLNGAADAERGRDYYYAFCAGCHADPSTDSTAITNNLPGAGGTLAFLAGDGKPSELMHKMRWGMPGTSMTREAMGYPTARDVADVLKYLEDPDAVPPPGAGDSPAVAAGRAKYDIACAACHRAASYDTTGLYSDLAGRSGLLVANLGASDPAMAGITLTPQEIEDLAAFLDSLSGVSFAANDDNASTQRDTAATIDVLANDIGTNLTVVAWDALTTQGGNVSCAATCVYTPPTGYDGTDSFNYTVSDGTQTATATVVIVV
ncbi:MAG: Ig-like domain-containing protein, partial [Gammaproteobacteria bacterium]|nr:Ig-like domain-containing protein [Gammaproteobacteria bacterium]